MRPFLIDRLREENEKLRKYAKYLATRMQDQAKIINEKVNPIVAASILDDLDDAASVAGIEPRDWESA